MSNTKIYSLRPPSVAREGLESLFRVEMKRDDMVAQGIKAGSPVLIQSISTGKGGVGIAYLSPEPSKSQGQNSFVKIEAKAREYLGLELSDKCSVSAYTPGLSKALEVVVSASPQDANDQDLAVDELRAWIEVALGTWSEEGVPLPYRVFAEFTAVFIVVADCWIAQIPAIAPGHSFTVSPMSGPSKHRKRSFNVVSIRSDETAQNHAIKIPSWYGLRSTRLVLVGSEEQGQQVSFQKEETEVMIALPGLPGLQKEMKELARLASRVNRSVEQRKQALLGCVPILLHGAQGTGKSTLLQQLEQCRGWGRVIRLQSNDFIGPDSKVEKKIEIAFSAAAVARPSLIVIDDLDEFASTQSESLKICKDLKTHIRQACGGRTLIIATAQRPYDIHQSLLSVFQKHIELPTPTPAIRKHILLDLIAAMTTADVIDYVADKTHAFNAEDLQTLCNNARDLAESRQIGVTPNDSDQNVQNGARCSLHIEDLRVSKADFEIALARTRPSLMHELYVEVPKVKWAEIAGSERVKQKLWEATELPLQHAALFSNLTSQSSQGILLFGPPGCSKTMTAKALATESGLNFIAVKGPELVSKYVGESEYKIREVFRKARAAAPSVIFFDEIDSIAPDRASGEGHQGLNTVATLLNEMDGVEAVQKVLVLAATNRPHAIDPALLRPGRLGTSIFVPPPDAGAVEHILKIRLAAVRHADDLDLSSLATSMSQQLFSGADVAQVCNTAGILCATEVVQNGLKEGRIERRHLEQALSETPSSLTKEAVDELRDWNSARRKGTQ